MSYKLVSSLSLEVCCEQTGEERGGPEVSLEDKVLFDWGLLGTRSLNRTANQSFSCKMGAPGTQEYCGGWVISSFLLGGGSSHPPSLALKGLLGKGVGVGEASSECLKWILSWSNGAYFKWSLQTIDLWGLKGRKLKFRTIL